MWYYNTQWTQSTAVQAVKSQKRHNPAQVRTLMTMWLLGHSTRTMAIVYNKRLHCVYCSKPYAKISRHLESAHNNKMDVAKAFSFPKGSKERKRQLDYICKKGNYAHNATVMETGKGQHVPCKWPPKQAQGVDFMHFILPRAVLQKDSGNTCGFAHSSLQQKNPNLDKPALRLYAHTLGLCRYIWASYCGKFSV